MEETKKQSVIVRNTFSSTRKMEVLRRYLSKREAVSELADEYKVAPSMIYQWTNRLMENGAMALEDKRRGDDQAVKAVNRKV
jgi:transposase-like protein